MNEKNNEYYQYFNNLIKRKTGIVFRENKKDIFLSKIRKRVENLNLINFNEYKTYIKTNPKEIIDLINYITINKTDFFREKKHFLFLKNELIKISKSSNFKKEILFWCAASSTGQEPYSIFITANEILGNYNIPYRILATDIDTNVLTKAHQGYYTHNIIKDIPEKLIPKYFDKKHNLYYIKDLAKKKVTFKRLNLNSKLNFPITKKYDFIFCRNVLIYFEDKTIIKLVNRFVEHLKLGGYLIISHTEYLPEIPKNLKQIKSSIFKKI